MANYGLTNYGINSDNRIVTADKRKTFAGSQHVFRLMNVFI